MVEDELRDRLGQAGLSRIVDEIMRLTRPCIRLDCHTTEEGALQDGVSKLGGLPDLPAGVEWPMWREQPMAFIAQVRLDDIAPFDVERALPNTGLLSCFCAVEGDLLADDDPAAWRVWHFTGEEMNTLARRTAPERLDELSRFRACAMTYARRPTLPDVDSHEVRALGLSKTERIAYVDVQTGGDIGYLPEMDHRLLGYPYTLGGSTLLECYVAAHGMDWHAGTRDAGELQDAAEEAWRLLLQVYSNEEAGMDWGGGGVLHFCLPHEALRTRDFSQVWVNLQLV